MRVGKIGVAIIGLVPFNVYGECTPTPDCDAIGYTETSCETKSVKCPFDTSKLFCIPCDSSFQYDCSGENITSGIGSACGDKYVSCECSSTDYVFSNGECICNTSCSVGAIYYSDGTCSFCVDNTKTAVGIVVKDDELIMSINIPFQIWATSSGDIAAITNINDKSVVKNDMNGVSNTAAIVAYYGSDVDVTTNAAVWCYNYAPTGMENTKTKWYLPAAGEIYTYFYGEGVNYPKISNSWNKLGLSLSSVWFWTSSEYSWDTAWYAGSETGGFYGYYKTTLTSSVACLLMI